MAGANNVFYILLGFAVLIALIAVLNYFFSGSTSNSNLPSEPVEPEILRRMYSYIDKDSFDTLIELFTRHNAMAGFPKFLSETRPAVAVERVEGDSPHDQSKTGLSRAGGGPDLPENTPWPRNAAGQPLLFLQQVNLRDMALAAETMENPLPKAGLLVFFYDYTNQPWGYKPEDWQGWKLVYVPEEAFSTLVYRPSEYPLRGNLESDIAVKFSPSYSIPSPADRFAEEIGYPEEYEFRYALQEAMQGKAPMTYFFGKPYGVQHDGVIGEARYTFFQSPLGGNMQKESDELPRRIKEEINEWFLLYQQNTDQTWMEFGDMGTIYFVMRKQDAARGNFDHVWVILQSS